jgi:putative ABC transport system permease protein
MPTIRSWIARLRNLFRKQQFERDLNDELATHLEMHIADNLRSGMTPEEARRDALLKLGGLEQTKESVRDQRGFPLLESLLQDIRFGLRMLRKSPAFTAVAVLTLALGIGANTAIFSAVNAFLIRPLPFPKSGELVSVYENNLSAGFKQFPVSGPKYLDWREQNTVFQDVGALGVGEFNLTGGAEPSSILTLMATPSYLRVLGVRPLLGRAFAEDEGWQGKNQVVILGHSFWRNQFGGRTDIIGRTVMLDGKTHTVVGVLPPGVFLDCGEFAVIPLVEEKVQGNGRGKPNVWHEYQVVARLKPGVSIQQSQAAMSGIAERLEKVYERGWGISIISMRDDYLAGWPDRPTIFLLQGAVLLVLLIACANTANLLLARATSRKQEMAVRLALGGSRSRVIRQLLVESVLLALLGGVAGLALASGGMKTLNYWLQWQDIRFWTEVRLDGSVLAVSFVLSVITGVIFGLAPALQITKPDLQTELKGAKTSACLVQHRTLNALAVAEIGLALVLLFGAGLFVRNLVRLHQVNPGFNPKNVLTMKVTLPESKYPGHNERVRFFDAALERVKALPGVRNTAVINTLPMGGGFSISIEIEGKLPVLPNGDGSQLRRISPDYFRTLGVPLFKGRAFTQVDRAGTSPVAIINEAMARRYFPGEDPIGAHLYIGDGFPNPRVIVGVANDERVFGLKSAAEPILYVPYAQSRTEGSFYFLTRSGANPLSLLKTVQHEIRTFDPELAFADTIPLERVVNNSILSERVGTGIVGSFSMLALVLAALGIYGVMANAVNQRTPEIGIRIALGAQTGDIHRMVVGKGMVLTALGIVLGLACSFGVTRLLALFLYGISPADPWTFAVVTVFLAAVSLLACYIPARRATRVDPNIALRYE